MDTKIVDIWVKRPCDIAYEPKHMTAKETEMRIDDIRRNIIYGNCVWEVLDDGGRVFLTMENYDKDNSEATPTAGPLTGFDKENPILCAEKKKEDKKETKVSDDEEKQKNEEAEKKKQEEEKAAEDELNAKKKSKSDLNDIINKANQFKQKDEYKKITNKQLPNKLDKLIGEANNKKNTPDKDVNSSEFIALCDQIEDTMEKITAEYKMQTSK